jgi:hypothetical protein
MRISLIVVSVLFSVGSFGQDSLRGKVLSVIGSKPIPRFSIRVNGKDLVVTDANGNFAIAARKDKVRLASIFGHHGFDTTVNAKTNQELQLYSASAYDSTLATYDIQHGTMRVFCGVAFAPMARMLSDDEFEKKYHVRYYVVGDFLPSSVAQMTSYNLVIADYLDRRHGTKWRAELRSDVLGIFKTVGSQQQFGVSGAGLKSNRQ